MLIGTDLITTVGITVIQLNKGLHKYLLMTRKAVFLCPIPGPRGRLFGLPQDCVSWRTSGRRR